MILDPKLIKRAICDAIECDVDEEGSSVRVGMPFDIGGGDLCDLVVRLDAAGKYVVSDDGATLERAMETGDRFSTEGFRSSLRSILDFYRITEVDGRLQFQFDEIQEIGEAVFELCQVFASITEISTSRSKRSPVARDRGQLRRLAKTKFKAAGLWDRGNFNKGKTVRAKLGDGYIPVKLDYSVGNPKHPEVAFLCPLASDSQSVLLAAAKFERLMYRKLMKRVSLVSSAGSGEEGAEWDVDRAINVLKVYGPVVDLDSVDAADELRELSPKI